MTIICPACNKMGTEKDFPYYGNQISRCNFCGVQLENSSQCPSCKSIMIAKHSTVNKLFKIKAIIDTFTGSLQVICRKCGHKSLSTDFNKVYMYRGKISISKK